MRATLAPPIALAIESVARLAAIEIAEGAACDFGEALGLDADELSALRVWLPELAPSTAAFEASKQPAICDDEAALRELLRSQCVASRPLASILPAIVARRSMREDHLWQDMGFPHRAALSQFISCAFPRLHAANDRDMKWKRFFYRALCEAEGFSLCAVPHCRDCADFERCFGAEDGQSAFARRARVESDGLAADVG
jgi:nitrogen fixation protein NifQ